MLFTLIYAVLWGNVNAFGGILFGALLGWYAAPRMKAASASVNVPDKDSFMQKLNAALAEMKCYPESQAGGLVSYRFKSPLKISILANEIIVKIEGGSATIFGPNMYVERLRAKLQQQ